MSPYAELSELAKIRPNFHNQKNSSISHHFFPEGKKEKFIGTMRNFKYLHPKSLNFLRNIFYKECYRITAK